MAETTTYTPENYQTSFVDFYNMGGIDVQKAPEPDPDASDPAPAPVTPNIFAPVSGESSGTNIFNAMSLSTGQPAFKVGTVDYVDYINNFEKNLENKTKTGVDRSLGDFGKWVAEQAKKPEMMIGTAMGTAMGMPGLGALTSIMGAKNRQRQYENASKIAATGGTGGTMFKIGGQTISRAPGTRRYEGTLAGVTQEQAAAIEAIGYNFIPGTFEENEVGFEGGGGYERSGKSGLAQIDGAIMDAYGNIHSASGMQGGTASQATALREKLYVDAMEKAGHSLAGVNVAEAALEMKQALDAAAKGGIGFFETVRRQDTGAYNKSLSGSQQFIQSYLAERHAEPIRLEEAPITKQSDIPSTATQESTDVNSGTGKSERENNESDTAGGNYGGREDTTSGYGGYSGGGNRRALGGRVGYAPGGAVGASPAGFVERPPSQVPEAATVADDKPMSVQEGTFVINAAAVEFAGEEDIADMLKKAYVKAGKKDMGGPSTQEIDIAVSRGEVIVPPHIAKIIGYDRLEKINNRGKEETSKRIEENGQQPVGAAEGGFLSRLFGFGKEEPQLTVPPSEEAEIPKQGFAEKPMAEASTPLPAYTDFENTARDLLLLLEGNVSEGYVPKGRSNSGVTVGIGFDVGQHNPSDLEKMGLNTSLIAKLTPYLKKKGQAARDVLETVPLKLTEPEMEEVNKLALRSKYEKFEKNYPEYAKIPDAGKRAVMFSASYLGALKRYETFRKEFDKGQNLKRAIKVGLFGKIKNQGDPEYNRAEKALDWYSEYERENMQLPTPKPSQMAGGGFLDVKKFANGGEVDEYEDKIIADEVRRKMTGIIESLPEDVTLTSKYFGDERAARREYYEEFARLNETRPLQGKFFSSNKDKLINAPRTPTLLNLYILAEEVAHQLGNTTKNRPTGFLNVSEKEKQKYMESKYSEELRAKRIAFDAVGGLFPRDKRAVDLYEGVHARGFANFILESSSPEFLQQMLKKYPKLKNQIKADGTLKELKKPSQNFEIAIQKEEARIKDAFMDNTFFQRINPFTDNPVFRPEYTGPEGNPSK